MGGRSVDLEYVNESDAHFGLIVAARDRAILDIAAVTLIESLAENLPILVEIIPIIVIDSKGSESTT